LSEARPENRGKIQTIGKDLIINNTMAIVSSEVQERKNLNTMGQNPIVRMKM
jgi:hypothetical protein